MVFILIGMSVCAEAQDITIVLDGQVMETESWDAKPFIKDDRVVVPVRHFAEAMGLEVEWPSNDFYSGFIIHITPRKKSWTKKLLENKSFWSLHKIVE